MSDVSIPKSFLKGIKILCVDASSMIYHLKIGLLGSLAAEIKLISTEQVIEEVGWPHLPVSSYKLDTEDISNDESLLVLAKNEKVPLLSEDKEILETAREEGIEYYNSLMMLNYLFMKHRISAEEYPEYLERLKKCSHYSPAIIKYGETIFSLLSEL